MAISGSAVPALQVWIENGHLKVGYDGVAQGAAVVDDVGEVYRLLMSGNKAVLMHKYGDNYQRLMKMVDEHWQRIQQADRDFADMRAGNYVDMTDEVNSTED